MREWSHTRLDPSWAHCDDREVRLLQFLFERLGDQSQGLSGHMLIKRVPRWEERTSILSAALLIEYDGTGRYAVGVRSKLSMLPLVLEICNTFFACPFLRNGRHTCETSAGPTVLVRKLESITSGSNANAESKNT